MIVFCKVFVVFLKDKENGVYNLNWLFLILGFRCGVIFCFKVLYDFSGEFVIVFYDFIIDDKLKI